MKGTKYFSPEDLTNLKEPIEEIDSRFNIIDI